VEQEFLIVLDGRFGAAFFTEQQQWINRSQKQMFFEIIPQEIFFEMFKNAIAVKAVIRRGEASA
jgi:hypothetical protein